MEDQDGTGDGTQGGKEQGREKENKAIKGDQRKIQMDQEMRLCEEKNKEESRKGNKAIEGDQRKIQMDKMIFREDKNKEEIR
jgi:hypothetical protein